MATFPLLRIEGLTRSGLAPVTLTVQSGDIVAISGPSGAGKSLFLRAIADLDPNEGAVHVAEADRAETPAPDWRRLVAYLPSESGWWAETVASHMTDIPKAAAMAVKLGLTEDVVTWQINRLSTGEKQRLALIRALEQGPRALLLDEPTSGLDPATTERAETLIKETCDQGSCALIVSHDEAQAERLGARRYRMDAGVLSVEENS